MGDRFTVGETDPAVRAIVDGVTTAAGEVLLRHALKGLADNPDGWRHAKAIVYQALMAACDAGYPCGMVTHRKADKTSTMFATIILPQGMVAIRMPQYGEDIEPSIVEDSRDIIGRFLDAPTRPANT